MSVPLRVYSEPSGDCQPRTVHAHEVQGVIDLYIDNLLGRRGAADYSADAVESTLRALRRFGAEFGCQDLASCRQHDLTRWLSMNPQWRAHGTKKRNVSAILACFRWAEEEELIDKNPYRWPKCLKCMPDKVRRPADASEYVKLMRFGSRPLRRALFFLRRTGIRPKEMRDLVWPDVDLGASPHLHLDRHKTRKKTGKPRRIGLDAATANFLRALRRNQRGNGERVFTNCEGTPWGRHTFAQHLRRHAERLGLDEGVEERVSAYCFRHTYTVDGIEGGVTTRRIADQLGHTKTHMIDTVYGSHTRERVEHLASVATEILRKRKRKKPAKRVQPREDGFHQRTFFDGPDNWPLAE